MLRRNIGPPLVTTAAMEMTFWEYLNSLCGEWMWDDILKGQIDVEWVKTAITDGFFIGVTNGSYDRKRAKTASGSEWVICCTKSRCLH